MEIKKYTCIKPTTINHEKVLVGHEIELTPEQARPLQHGGFITFDDEAAKCIRLLTKGEEVLAVVAVESDNPSDDSSVVSDNTALIENNSRTSSVSSVAFEKGD